MRGVHWYRPQPLHMSGTALRSMKPAGPSGAAAAAELNPPSNACVAAALPPWPPARAHLQPSANPDAPPCTSLLG
eukprot:5699209-Prymnesium_polylepis.1